LGLWREGDDPAESMTILTAILPHCIGIIMAIIFFHQSAEARKRWTMLLQKLGLLRGSYTLLSSGLHSSIRTQAPLNENLSSVSIRSCENSINNTNKGGRNFLGIVDDIWIEYDLVGEKDEHYSSTMNHLWEEGTDEGGRGGGSSGGDMGGMIVEESESPVLRDSDQSYSSAVRRTTDGGFLL